MGGKALSIQTKRVLLDEYNSISNNILKIFHQHFGEDNVAIPPFIRNKKEFGDLDIVVKINPFINIKDFIIENFKPTDINKNDNVISFDYLGFQIDIISVSVDNFDTTLKYMSWNDAGNFVGRIANRFGLKFSMAGLYLKYKDSEILLTKDLHYAIELLGFNLSKYIEGFDSNEDLFNWVIDSKYFAKNIFKFNNDDKKRPIYNQFLNYIDTIDKPDYLFSKDKTVYLGLINSWFPNVIKFVLYVDTKIELQEKSQEIFNGKLVMERYTELNGKQLGDVIKSFKATKENNEEFQKYIINTDIDTIWKEFHEIYEIIKIRNNING